MQTIKSCIIAREGSCSLARSSKVPSRTSRTRSDASSSGMLLFFFFWCAASGALSLTPHRMVAEAAKPKKKQAPPSAAMQAAQNRAHEARHLHADGAGNTTTAAGFSLFSTSPPQPQPALAPHIFASTS